MDLQVPLQALTYVNPLVCVYVPGSFLSRAGRQRQQQHWVAFVAPALPMAVVAPEATRALFIFVMITKTKEYGVLGGSSSCYSKGGRSQR